LPLSIPATFPSIRLFSHLPVGVIPKDQGLRALLQVHVAEDQDSRLLLLKALPKPDVYHRLARYPETGYLFIKRVDHPDRKVNIHKLMQLLYPTSIVQIKVRSDI